MIEASAFEIQKPNTTMKPNTSDKSIMDQSKAILRQRRAMHEIYSLIKMISKFVYVFQDGSTIKWTNDTSSSAKVLTSGSYNKDGTNFTIQVAHLNY